MEMSAVISLCLTACLVAIETSAVPRVISMDEHSGSTEGGVRLHIHGEEFSSSANFNSDPSQGELGNKVYLKSDKMSSKCMVEKDASHEKMIVCYTGSMVPNEYYYVYVEVDGTPIPFETNCNNNPRHWRCRFIARWYYTPYIRTCHVTEDLQFPQGTSHVPGSLVTCSGRIFTQIYGSNNQTNPNEKTASFRRVYAGGQTCELLKEPDVFYDLRLVNGDEGTFTCKTKGTFIGHQNISFIITDEYGRSQSDIKLFHVSGKDKVYNFQTYAEITNITPSIGSAEGGTKIKIEGRNFDDTNGPVKILVGGVDCDVIPGSLTTSGVQCIARKAGEASDYYAGSRGVMTETWNQTTVDYDQTILLERNVSNYEGERWMDSTGHYWNHSKDTFVAKFTGIFVAPKADRYKFKIRGDDRAGLYMNCDGNRTNLTLVVSVNRPLRDYYDASQTSDWTPLEEGQQCYFECGFAEHGGAGYLYIAAQRATTTLTATQSYDAKNEIQRIDFHSTFSVEKQNINFTNWQSQAGTVEVQTVTVQHACIDNGACDNIGYRLVYDGVKTIFIAADASASTVKNSLNNIFVLSSEEIAVSKASGGTGQLQYTVEFRNKSGDYDMLSHEVYPAGVSGLTVSISETTKGVSDRKDFKLRLAGRYTAAIREGANADAIEMALDATREAYCPSFLLPDRKLNTVVTTRDYEPPKYGSEWGYRRTDVEAFCGRTSLLNPDYIYRAGRTADSGNEDHSSFNAHEYGWMCLAHLGIMNQHMWIDGTFRGGDNPVINGQHHFILPLVKHETEWRYSCLNLMEIINSRNDFSHVDQASINVIKFAKMDHDHNFYIDAFTIGSSKVTEDLDGVLSARTPPALANGEPISEVHVTGQEDGSFQIQVDTYNCGHNVPLVSLAFVSVDTQTTDHMTQRESTWDDDVTFVTSRTSSGVEPMIGQFDLTVTLQNGQSYNLTDIPVEINTKDFEERLENEVPGFGQAKVSRTGSCHATDYDVQWMTNGGDKPLMEVRMSGVQGADDITATVKTLQDGGALHDPITGDMLRMAYDEPQVEVFINGLPSYCVDDCQFTTAEAVTPVVSGISPTTGSSHISTVITISGTNLNALEHYNTTVQVGEADCEVLTNTETEITCQLEEGPLGSFDVVLNVGGKGYARKESVNVSVVFSITGGATAVNPTSGYNSGGTEVTITGYGFTSTTTFQFGDNLCPVKSFTVTKAICTTPFSSSGNGNVVVTAADGSFSLGTLSFEYNSTSAVVTAISPTTSTLNGGGNLTITGTGLGAEGENARVMLGEYNCSVLERSSSEIVCQMPSAPAASYKLYIVIEGKGYADTSTNSISNIAYNLEVTGISPDTGSMNGGARVTISGEGFTDKESMEVKFGDSPCAIDTVSPTSLVCVTGRTTTTHIVTNNGIHETQGKGFAWDPLALTIHAGDTVTWKWELNGAPDTRYGAKVFTTATVSSDDYDEVGFRSSTIKTQKGSYSYTFNNEGMYYISSGKIDDDVWGSLIMRCSINVLSSISRRSTLSVKVAKYEALYAKSSRRKREVSSCAGAITTVPGCTPDTVADDPANFGFVSGTCYTPTVTSISPSNGTAGGVITIKGTGFGTENCANKVTIAGSFNAEYECEVTSSTATTIKCKPRPVEATSINVAYPVSVDVADIGESSSVIKLDADRRFTLRPSVSSVSPGSGSLSGGTLLSISGYGFSSSLNDISATVGGYSCFVQSTSYFEIQCLTPTSGSETTQTVAVTTRGQAAECTGNCDFAYSASKTPTVTLIDPVSTSLPNQAVSFTGTNFASNDSNVHVKFGDHVCQVNSATSTSITCTIEYLPAGTYPIQVDITGKGKAKLEGVTSQFQSTAIITSMQPINGSKAGGTVLTFEGNGFKSDDLAVGIGNKDCVVKNENLTNLWFQCETPPKSGSGNTKTITVTANGQTYTVLEFTYATSLTPTLISISPYEGLVGDTITITGTRLDPSDMTVHIGEAECVHVSGNETEISCATSEHPGGNYPVTARVGILGLATSSVTFNYTFDVTSVSPSRGSFAGGDLLTISGRGFGPNITVGICDSVCQHGPDFSGTSAINNEIVCLLSADSSTSYDTDKACNITATIHGQSATGEGLYTFAADRTPFVTAVSPTRGGTQGGTNIMITGTLFNADHTQVSVVIGDVVCVVTSSTTTMIKCTTGARGKSIKEKIVVTVTGKGIAANNDVEFYYVDVWSSRWTWGGQEPPVAGDFIVVPTGQTLVLDIDTPVLKMLLIQGGVVMFDAKDVHLQVENIFITDGGMLQIGTEEEPFEHKAIITLHGHLRSPELPIYGTKSIGVRNGTLDLHGMHVPITWTHLGQTAAAGATTLLLKDSVSWKPGDEIVIATTGERHSQRETETAFIQAVSAEGTTLTLVEPLEYEHLGTSKTFPGITLETRAEVGLLTRNIVIQGSKHMEWARDVIPACEDGFDTGEFVTQTCFQGRFGEEEGSDKFGAQIMIHHSAPNLDLAHARLEFVELRHMGQAFRLGRYPIHFHMLGDVQFKSYVKGCAIHNTFNRAVTIHNTHHLLVDNNVIHDVMGGAVFIEDGIEHGNVIQYNLVLMCKQSTSLQNDDITPAAFWVTNPNNTIRHNAAAGGTHFGFWYRIHATPDGPSADASICQQLHPLQSFENNTAHSQGWFGLWVFQKYTPRGDGSCGSTTPAVANFQSLTAWNCEKGAELVNVGAIRFTLFVMAQNEIAGIEIKKIVDSEVNWGDAGTYDSFIIAHTDSITQGGTTSTGIILPFTEGYEVIGTKFINFDESGSVAVAVTKIDGTCTVLCGGWEARFANISYVTSPNKARFRWEHEVFLRDLDGTLTGTGTPSVVTPFNPTMSLAECPEISDFSEGVQKGVMCPASFKFHRVSWNNVLPTSLEAKNVTFANDHGTSYIPFAKKRLTHKFGWMGTMRDGQEICWEFDGAGQITNISYSAGFYTFEPEDCVIVCHNLTQKPDKFIIAGDDEEYEHDSMVNCADNYHGDYHFDPNTKTLFYIVSGRDRSSRKRRFSTNSATPGAVNREINFRVYRCYYEKCIKPPNPNDLPPARERPSDSVLWHSSNWKFENNEYIATKVDGTIANPPDNMDVRIESETWMVANQDFPRINKLWIEGVLELEWQGNLQFTLSATHIMIMGGRLIVGWEDSSFQGLANILLRGDINTPDIPLNGEINSGSKAIAVIGGGLDLHGFNRHVKSHLATALTAGGNSITVQDSSLEWRVDDDIVIATTSNDPWETETFKINAISGNTLTLNATARFDHMAETFTYNDGNGQPQTYDIRAEVCVLTKNIKVIGEDYNNLYGESFGARVLVAGIGGTRGFARIQNTEFYHTGQEGFIDNYDPRYSVAFLNTGQVDTVRPSFIQRNTFHHCFNTAIGVFGATGLSVDNNIIHHTVGPGIRVEGNTISVTKNLVMLTRTRSVYQDRNEDDLLLWKAAIEVNLATDPYLADNVVAGSERAGYRIDGHNCDPSGTPTIEWGRNTVRAALQGIWMNKDGFPICTSISKFNIHNAYDYGVYYQASSPVEISDVLVTDSNLAFVPLVFGPASKSHVFQDKYIKIERCTVVAVSKTGYCPTLPDSTDFLMNSGLARITRRDGNDKLARTAILFPSFSSGHNAAVSKPFVGSKSYPAIGGRMDLRNFSFVNFGDTSCSTQHSAFMTNLKAEDFNHPIRVNGLLFYNSPESSRIFLHRPSIGKINPSDCVDMECDGAKNVLLTDEDGSLLGSPGTVIPQAEFEWGGDPRRGLGDYRIPKTLLTELDGSRIEVDDLVPNKGILRANTSSTSCTYNPIWRAYECHGYNHGILIIESLDADTETRRLSPVALKSGTYIDLFNGPQDHGWCAGYTCQERLSTFWTIVAFENIYEMHFTGTAPERLRLRMLNAADDTKMILKIFYTRPQRLDVYVDGGYKRTTNTVTNAEGQDVWVKPAADNPTEYEPTLNMSIGVNYYDRQAKIIHVVLTGQAPVDIYEAPVVVITFDLPAVSPDEFFDNGQLVANLAAFLNIPASKIRIVNVIREGSARRRKRETGAYKTTVEIGDPPAATIDPDTTVTTTSSPGVTQATTTASPDVLTTKQLLGKVASLVSALQENKLKAVLGIPVKSMEVSDPRVAAVRNPNNTDSNDTLAEETSFVVPSGLKIVQQPTTGNADSNFVPSLMVSGIDSSGSEIVLGHKADPWQATVTILSGPGEAQLSGTATAEFIEGYASFTDISVSLAGTYVLHIAVSYPSSQSSLFAETANITVEGTLASTTDTVTTTASVEIVPPAENNLAIIIACSVVGGLLLIAIIIVIIVKGPCSSKFGSHKVANSDIDLQSMRSGTYKRKVSPTHVSTPPALTPSNVVTPPAVTPSNGDDLPESQHPHSVTDNGKNGKQFEGEMATNLYENAAFTGDK